MNTKEVKRHLEDIKSSPLSPEESSKTDLLNTIKLPKKLLDITKRLPKANYASPQVIKKKALEIKIAKGLPDIFEQPKPSSSNSNSQSRSIFNQGYDNPISLKELSRSPNKASNEVSLILRNRLYKRIVKPDGKSPSIDYTSKVRLPKIHRVSTNHHNYSINYSSRSLNNRRALHK